MKDNNNHFQKHKEDNINLKTLIALSRCSQNVHKREFETMKKGGLTVSQFAVLEVLYHKGDLRVSEILDKILATGGNMTVVIENLIKERLVKRNIDINDRRVNIISITDKGRDLMSQIFPEHVENINTIFNVLSTEEKQTLIRLLKKLSGIEPSNESK